MAIRKPTMPLSNETEIEDLEPSDSDPETESESESEGDEDVKLTEPSKTAVYNKDAILEKLTDISWPAEVDWAHKLSLDVDQAQEIDVNDDLARELAFYTQALEGTREAFLKFQSAGLPFLRPADYYAEMVKTDSHMEKIKGRLLAEKRRMEEADERRKARDNKKKAKEVQAEKTKERVKQKKEEIESVKKWRKQRQQSGFAGGDKDGEVGLPFSDGGGKQQRPKKRQQSGFSGGDKDAEAGLPFSGGKKGRPGVAPWDRTGGKAAAQERKGGSGKGKRKGRDFKDKKYGFGGRKGMMKQNTAETTNDFGGSKKSDSSQNKKRKK